MAIERGKWAAFVRMLCAVAVLFLSVGHQAQARSIVPDAALAAAQDMSAGDRLALTLPDGSVPDLCLPGAPEKHGPAVKPCDLCRIAQAFLLPPPADLGWLQIGEPARHAPPHEALPVPTRDWQIAAPRGPPADILTA